MAISCSPRAVELRVADIIGGLQIRGVAFDTARATAMQAQWFAATKANVDRFALACPARLKRQGADRWYGLRWKEDADKLTGYHGAYTTFEWHPFNPNSGPDCILELTRLGWAPQSYTASGQAELTDEILSAINLPLAVELAEHRKLVKKLGMLDGYLEVVDGGRIYHSVHTIGAITYRMSHSKPNLGQVPKSDDLRGLFTASPGMVLVGVDADAIEARMLAAQLTRYDNGALVCILETGNKKSGTDFHSLNQRAIGMFNRESAKTFLYAMVYGGGLVKLGMTIAEDAIAAGQPITTAYQTAGKTGKNKLMKSITGFRPMLHALQAQWHMDGYILACDGRRLYPKGNHVVLNTLLQANGAIAMKLALVLCYDAIKAAGIIAHHVLNIHDECVWECAPEDAAEVLRLQVWAIEEAGRRYGLACPLRANGKTGQSWKDTK